MSYKNMWYDGGYGHYIGLDYQTIPPVAPVAEVRPVQHVDVRQMATEIAVMESKDREHNRIDADARVAREKAIGAKMMAHFLTLAKQHGVELPPAAQLGGRGGWLSRRDGLLAHATFAHDWRGYELHTGLSHTRFCKLFRWAHDPVGAQADLAKDREHTNRANKTTSSRRKAAAAKARRAALQEVLEAYEKHNDVEAVIAAIREELAEHAAV